MVTVVPSTSCSPSISLAESQSHTSQRCQRKLVLAGASQTSIPSFLQTFWFDDQMCLVDRSALILSYHTYHHKSKAGRSLERRQPQLMGTPNILHLVPRTSMMTEAGAGHSHAQFVILESVSEGYRKDNNAKGRDFDALDFFQEFFGKREIRGWVINTMEHDGLGWVRISHRRLGGLMASHVTM